jgi:hypothetical protein
VREVRAEVLPRGDGLERVAQLVALDVDRDVAAAEELQAAGVIELQVREHDRPDGGAPVSNSTGPIFGCSISEAMIATVRRATGGLGSDAGLTPPPASGNPSSYSSRPRSSR